MNDSNFVQNSVGLLTEYRVDLDYTGFWNLNGLTFDLVDLTIILTIIYRNWLIDDRPIETLGYTDVVYTVYELSL